MISTGEWGSFFDARICPHAYNDSLAYDYYPVEDDDAAQK
jgi:hypothetical protein